MGVVTEVHRLPQERAWTRILPNSRDFRNKLRRSLENKKLTPSLSHTRAERDLTIARALLQDVQRFRACRGKVHSQNRGDGWRDLTHIHYAEISCSCNSAAHDEQRGPHLGPIRE